MNKDYYNRINPDVLKMIPCNANFIAEVGCGAGVLGEAYRQINPKVFYTGLEVNPDAAKIASERLNKVITGDVENISLGNCDISLNSLDCLIYGDVLEHLYDPAAVLKNHSNYLKDDGQIIACIPNIQHWSILFNLLQGKWDYTKEGLLDSTHLRFFTLNNIRKLFIECGLKIVEIQPRQFEPIGNNLELFKKFNDLITPVIKEFGVDPKQFRSQIKSLQYIVRAVKSGVKIKPLLIQTMIGEEKVCSRVRVTEPHSFCSTIPGVKTVESNKTVDLNIGNSYENKVFIWQRIISQKPDQQKQLFSRNYLVINEIDDDPLRWEEQFKKNNFFAFRSCHGVQVSTEPLAEFLKQFNPNVKVFKNQLAYLPPVRTYKNEKTTIFFGALNREEDWKPILHSLNKVISDYEDKISVKIIHDKLFFDSLNTKNKEFKSYCPYNVYENILKQCDIAILPLEFNHFNSMKSDLKFIECAGHGVATLATPTVYKNTIDEGKTGLIYNSVEEFEEKLVKLIEDVDFRHELAKNAYNYVAENRLLSMHYQERTDWYYEMIEKLPQLNEELKSRAPELF